MTEKSAPVLLNGIIEGLTQATGACSQLIHAHQDPRFMMLRETLESARDICKQQATFAATKITRIRPI